MHQTVVLTLSFFASSVLTTSACLAIAETSSVRGATARVTATKEVKSAKVEKNFILTGL